jgi:hypothetical protein
MMKTPSFLPYFNFIFPLLFYVFGFLCTLFCAFVCFSHLLDWSDGLDLEKEREVDNWGMRWSDFQIKPLNYEKYKLFYLYNSPFLLSQIHLFLLLFFLKKNLSFYFSINWTKHSLMFGFLTIFFLSNITRNFTIKVNK